MLQGIVVGKLWKGFPTSIARLSGEICSRLGFARQFQSRDVPMIENDYVGEAYGVPSHLGVEAISYLARREGILLDPVYTGKAFAGMLDLCRQEKLGEEEPVIFLHTGGSPTLFAYNDFSP